MFPYNLMLLTVLILTTSLKVGIHLWVRLSGTTRGGIRGIVTSVNHARP